MRQLPALPQRSSSGLEEFLKKPRPPHIPLQCRHRLLLRLLIQRCQRLPANPRRIIPPSSHTGHGEDIVFLYIILSKQRYDFYFFLWKPRQKTAFYQRSFPSISDAPCKVFLSSNILFLLYMNGSGNWEQWGRGEGEGNRLGCYKNEK